MDDLKDDDYIEQQRLKALEAFSDIPEEHKTETSSPRELSAFEIQCIRESEARGTATSAGFGFFDACDYEPKADITAWIIKDVLPKNSFGFVAGPAKGGASPFGGKSVLNRKMALSIITGQPFFGHDVVEKGKVMFVNLDEDQDKQVRLYYRMTKGVKIPGFLISRARACRLPEQVKLLESDIALARPILVNIDPMQRIMGGKKVNEQSDVGPIIDELKRLSKEYDCTISVNHHANKSSERDRETTSSWLSGSNDLDAAWDFCHCLEYNREKECVHFRNFQKEKAKTDLFYEAEIVNTDEIVDLINIPEELSSSKKARDIYKTITFNQNMLLPDLLKKLDMPGRTFYNYIEKLPLLKTAYGKMTQVVEGK